jgi:6-phosphogluconate dehydrogenase
MQLGMIGLGRMGGNMVRRLMRAGHECIVFDRHPEAVQALAAEGATGSASLEAFVERLKPPRAVWMMVPAAAVDATIASLAPLLSRGDIVIDGGNSSYREDLRHAAALQKAGLHYVDVGTSGGVWGLENGYCLMIGGDADAVARLQPVFAALSPGGAKSATASAPAGTQTAAQGYLHCGPSGAGHFVKMVHNGIEYGVMAAYAEGFNLLHHANVGAADRAADAETAPLQHPEAYRYDFDVAAIAQVWRQGSVIRSWLLDLIAHALQEDPALDSFRGRVSDSGEGRWTLQAGIDAAVPLPVLSAALYQRFTSRGEAAFADKLLSAMRSEFGGHAEHGTGRSGS